MASSDPPPLIPPSSAIWFGHVDDPSTGRRVPAKAFEDGPDGGVGLVICEHGRKLRAVDDRAPVEARSMDPPVRKDIADRLRRARVITFEGRRPG